MYLIDFVDLWIVSDGEARKKMEEDLRKAITSKLPVINDFFHALKHA